MPKAIKKAVTKAKKKPIAKPVKKAIKKATAPKKPRRLKDSDGDGLSDFDEINIFGSDPYNADSNGDGLEDGEAVLKGRDPVTGGKIKDFLFLMPAIITARTLFVRSGSFFTPLPRSRSKRSWFFLLLPIRF